MRGRVPSMAWIRNHDRARPAPGPPITIDTLDTEHTTHRCPICGKKHS